MMAVFHQETIYSATVKAIPFLIKLLEDESVPEREWVLQVLANIIQCSYSRETWRMEMSFEGEEYTHPIYTPSLLEELRLYNQEELKKLRAARVEVLKGVDAYSRILDRVRAFLILGTSIVAPEGSALLSDIDDPEAAPIIRVAIGLGLWYREGKLPADMQDELVGALREDPDSLIDLDLLLKKHLLKLMERELFEFLNEIDRQHGEQLLPALVEVYFKYLGRFDLLLPMLKIAFHENVLESHIEFKQLTKNQQTVLKMIAGQDTEFSTIMADRRLSVQAMAYFHQGSIAWLYGPHIPDKLHQLGIVNNDRLNELEAFIEGKRTAGIPLSEQGD